MTCSACLREKPIVARGLCNACYQRWRKTGTTDYQRIRARSTCSVGGCDKPVVSHGLCDMHRRRMERHGHLEETRDPSWGSKKGKRAKNTHPLYWAWRTVMRRGHAPAWDDFLQFIVDVGEKPSTKHSLYVANEELPIGPGNFVWKRSPVERVDGEDERTFSNRRMRAYRQLQSENFRATGLKRLCGLTREEYAALREAHGDRCAICGEKETTVILGKQIALSVDHCHTKGKARGLLCAKCNQGLGCFRDRPDLLRRAADYLIGDQ